MAESGKKVEVRFGAFSCSIEGYDNPVEQMREVLLLMQGMIRETPALADHGPGFGEAEVARIEHALDRRAERQAGGPGIVVIRGPEAIRNGDHEAEDAVTTADIPPGTRRLAEAGDDQPGDGQPGDGQASRGQARGERDDGDAERPLGGETGGAPAAAAIFSAPAAALAEAAFSADLAGTDDPGSDARTGSGGTDGSDPDRAGSTGDRSPAGTGQPDMAADAAAAEHADDTSPATGARAEEANRLWQAAAPDAGEAPAGDRRSDVPEADVHTAAEAHADVADAAPAEQPNHLWDAVDAAPPDSNESPGAETALIDAAGPGEALDEAAPAADALGADQPASDAGRRGTFARDEAAGLPHDRQIAKADKQADAAVGEHERELRGDFRAGDAAEQAAADGDRPTGSQAPGAEHDDREERSTGGSDGNLKAAAEAALAAHGFRAETAEGGDRQGQQAGRGPAFAPPDFAPPEEQHEATAAHPLNIFAPPLRSPVGRAVPAAAAMNIFAPPSDAGGATAAAAVNIFAPPPGTRSPGAAPPEAGRPGRLFFRTAAGPARRPAPSDRMAVGDEAGPDPTPRPEGAGRAGRPENGTPVQPATQQPAKPPPALRREPGPAAAAWDGSADETDSDDGARPAGMAYDRSGAGWPGAGWNDGLAGGDEDADVRPDGGSGGGSGGGSDGGSGGAADWNDGLREPPGPPRARRNEERSRFSALLARLGGRRTAGGRPQAEPPKTTPDAPSTTGRDDAGPADLAERAGASSVADLLAVAAAWLTLVEGKPRFTRSEVMGTFERLPGNHPRTLEARIKGFGKLVRSSTLIVVDDGVFAMAQAERDRYQAMIDDG